MKGATLKAARVDLGMTQVEFAVMLGTTWRTVQRWENGEHVVPRTVALVVEMLPELERAAERLDGEGPYPRVAAVIRRLANRARAGA